MRDFVQAARVIINIHHHTVILFQHRTSIDPNQPHQTTTAMMTLKRTIKKQRHQTTAPSRQRRAIDCSSFPLRKYIKFDLLTRSLVWRLRFVCRHKPCWETATPFMIVVGQTCPFCPLAFRLTFHPRPILKFLMLI